MKRILIALLVLLSMAALPEVSTAENQSLVCVVAKGQYVNVRNQPRSDAQKVGEMHNGDKIDAVSVKDGWIEIEYKDHPAYVNASYFEIPEAEGGTLYTVRANGRVRVRSAPDGKRIDWIEPGTTVRVYGWRHGNDESKWARCIEGYIASDYLELSGETAQ